MGDRLVVVTQSGDVFGHDVSGRDVGPAFKFGGSKVASQPQDRFVVAMGDKLIVTTQNGDAFGHEVSGRDIGPAFLLNPADLQTFDAVDADDGSTQLKSSHPLSGSAHLVVTDTGAFSFSSHAHDSGFDNIDYSLGAVLMTSSGLAFTFAHQGHVEGTIAGLPFGKPERDHDRTSSGSNPALKDEFERLRGAVFVGDLGGTDTLQDGVTGLINEALKSAARTFGEAGAKAVVALVK
jgi:hypothetical protein